MTIICEGFNINFMYNSCYKEQFFNIWGLRAHTSNKLGQKGNM